MLDKTPKEILRIYSSRQCLSLMQLSAILNIDGMSLAEPVNFLRKQKYLRIEANHAVLNEMTDDSLISLNDPLEITFQGRAALELEQEKSKEKKLELIRYIITTAIAVAAFIKSFFF